MKPTKEQIKKMRKHNKTVNDFFSSVDLKELKGLECDVVKLPKDFWQKEAEKFSNCMNKILTTRIEKVKQKGKKIEGKLCVEGKMPML